MFMLFLCWFMFMFLFLFPLLILIVILIVTCTSIANASHYFIQYISLKLYPIPDLIQEPISASRPVPRSFSLVPHISFELWALQLIILITTTSYTRHPPHRFPQMSLNPQTSILWPTLLLLFSLYGTSWSFCWPLMGSLRSYWNSILAPDPGLTLK